MPRTAIRHILTAIFLSLLVMLVQSCGGGKSAGINATPGGSAAHPGIKAASLPQELLEEIDSLELPEGVDPAVWDQLRDGLKRVLAEQGIGRAASADGTHYDAVQSFTVTANEDGSATFNWTYYNMGDYDQNSEVNVNDITPVGHNWKKSTSDGENDPAEEVVDGDQNSEVNINDLTPLGWNWQNKIDGYLLMVSQANDPDGQWETVAVIPFSEGILPEDRGWLEFSYRLYNPDDLVYFMVVPYTGDPGDPQLGGTSVIIQFNAGLAGAPQNLTASQGSVAHGISLEWDDEIEAYFYKVYRGEQPDGSDAVHIGSTDDDTRAYTDYEMAIDRHFFYSVVASRAGGDSPASNLAEGWAMLAPEAPRNLIASNGTYSDRVELVWEAAARAEWYEVKRAMATGGDYIPLGQATSVGYTDTTGAAGTGYFYVVQAYNPAGSSGPSNPAYGLRALAGAAPKVDAVSPLDGNERAQVTFSAQVSGGTVEEYVWDYGGAATVERSYVPSPTVTLGDPGEYDAFVVVSNDFGINTFDFKITVHDIDDPPELISVAPTTGETGKVVTFTATVAGGLPDTWSWDFNGGTVPAASTDASPTVVLGNIGVYSCSVTATNSMGSDTLDFNLEVEQAPLEPPLAPIGLVATNGASTQYIRLTWQKSNNATGYNVYRDTQDTPVQALGDVATWDDPVTDYILHTYWVTATNSDGESTFSNSDTGYRRLPPPVGLNASDGTQAGKIVLNWSSLSGASGYQIFRDDSTGPPYATVGLVTTWEDDPVGDFTQHEYWLKATNALSTSNLSASDTGYVQLTQPTGFAASDGTHTDRVALSWTKPTAATGYKLWRDDNSGSPDFTVGDVASYDDTTVADTNAHTYWIKASYPAGDSAFGPSDTGFQALSPPGSVQATDGTLSDRITISWTAVSGATGYKIWRDSTAGAPVHTTGAVTSWEDTSISDYDAHEYWVKAANAQGDSALSGPDTGYITLPVPTSVAATDGTYTDRVRVTWVKPGGATGFKVWRDDNTGAPDQTLGSVSQWDDMVGDTAVHTYWVKAVYGAGDSALSASDTGYKALTAPQNVQASDGTYSDRIAVSWNSVSGATGYKIWRDDSTGSPDQTVGAVMSWDDTSISDYDTHEYWVKATNAQGDSALSASDTGYRALAGPTVFAASDGTFDDRIQLTWVKATGATGYKIWRNDNSGDADATVGDVAAWDDLTISDHAVHSYWIKAVYGAGDSAFVGPDSGFMGLAAPLNLDATDGDFNDHIGISWDAVTGATGYKLYRDSQSNLVQTLGAVTGWDDYTLVDSGLHTYWVKATLGAIESDYSDPDEGFISTSFSNSWSFHVIDQSAEVGSYSDLKIVAGFPAVSYYDIDNTSLKYAYSTAAVPNSSTDWTYHTVDNSSNVGYYQSALADIDGKPVIAYYDTVDGSLNYVQSSVAYPTQGSDWTKHEIDDVVAQTGLYPSIQVINGKPAIAYQRYSTRDIMFAIADSANPTSSSDWTIHTVDSANNLGDKGISLILLGGNPAIAYYDSTGNDLKFAQASVAEPDEAADWTVHVMDATNTVGGWPSLMDLNGKPAVCYHANLSNLIFARATVSNPTLETDWIKMTVDTATLVGSFGTSLEVINFVPCISYHDEANGNLKFAYSATTEPTIDGHWNPTVVDTDYAGYYSSLQRLGGLPGTTYLGNDRLMFARMVP